jgi:hypothetical protein
MNAKNLPKGMTAADLKYDQHDRPEGAPWEDRMFQLWLIKGFGWVIPTLAIRKNGQRTYAVALGEGGDAMPTRGAQVRVGMGPHVLEQHTVYVRGTRREAMQPFLDLRRKGEVDSNMTRDRISTRRMRRSMW